MYWSKCIIIKNILILSLSFLVVSCNNKTKELDYICQNWDDDIALSSFIYNKLKTNTYKRFVSIKQGSDRGFFGFYFVGETNNSGVLIYSNGVELVSGILPFIEVKKIFSLLPNEIHKLKGYTGSGEVWSHLSCAYMKIKLQEQSKVMSFQDYVLKTTQAESSSTSGVAIMTKVKKYIDNEILDPDKENKYKLKMLKISSFTTLNKEENKKINERKVNDPIFYEIP